MISTDSPGFHRRTTALACVVILNWALGEVFAIQNDPIAGRSPGVYYASDGGALTRTDSHPLTVFEGMGSRYWIRMDKARDRPILSNCQPTFYFIVQGMTVEGSSVTSAGQFVLSRGTADWRGKRNFQKNKMLGGIEVVQFTSDEVKPGVFRVTPSSSLPDAEYVFFFGSPERGPRPLPGDGFDFAVKCSTSGGDQHSTLVSTDDPHSEIHPMHEIQ